MRKNYDFSNGVRGKYASLFSKDAVMVLLDPDVAAVFKDAKAVNAALRKVGGIIRKKSVAASPAVVREKKPRYGK